jgi:hypothetical protein
VTANAAGPVLRVLAREFGVERAFLSTVHAYTSQLRLADVPTNDMRSGRAAAENIIPQRLAARAMEAFLSRQRSRARRRVPVRNGSPHHLLAPAAVTVAVNAVMRGGADPLRILASRRSHRFDIRVCLIGPSIRCHDGDRRGSRRPSWYDSGYCHAHPAVGPVVATDLDAPQGAGRVKIRSYQRLLTYRRWSCILADRENRGRRQRLYENEHLAYLLNTTGMGLQKKAS